MVFSGRLPRDAIQLTTLSFCAQFTSVQGDTDAPQKPIRAPPQSLRSIPNVAFETIAVSSDWRGHFPVVSGKIVERFLFPRLSPPGDR